MLFLYIYISKRVGNATWKFVYHFQLQCFTLSETNFCMLSKIFLLYFAWNFHRVFIECFQSFSFSLALTNERVSKRKLKARMKKKKNQKCYHFVDDSRECFPFMFTLRVGVRFWREKKKITPMPYYSIYHKYEYGILFLWPTFSAARSLSSSLNIW